MATDRRTRTQIICDILNLCAKDEGKNKTAIVYGANLNFKTVQSYIKMLLEKGYISNGSRYVTTPAGKDLIKSLKEAIGMMGV